MYHVVQELGAFSLTDHDWLNLCPEKTRPSKGYFACQWFDNVDMYRGLTVGFLFLLYSVVEYLSLFHLLFISRFVFTRRCCIDKLRIFHADPNIYLSCSTSEIRVRLVQWN